MGSRRRSREVALQVLCMAEASGQSLRQSSVLHERHFRPLGDDTEFTRMLLRYAEGHIDEVDQEVRSSAARWRLERMSLVDRNLLRLGICEMRLPLEIPLRITLNEMVELAKKFGAEDSPSFVNGVLDGVAGKNAADGS